MVQSQRRIYCEELYHPVGSSFSGSMLFVKGMKIILYTTWNQCHFSRQKDFVIFLIKKKSICIIFTLEFLYRVLRMSRLQKSIHNIQDYKYFKRHELLEDFIIEKKREKRQVYMCVCVCAHLAVLLDLWFTFINSKNMLVFFNY